MDPISADWNKVAETAQRYSRTPRTIDARLKRVMDGLRGPAMGRGTLLSCAVGLLLIGGAAAANRYLHLSWLVVAAAVPVSLSLVAAAFVSDQLDRRNTRRGCEDALVNLPVYVGHVVQANTALFEPGGDHLPALVVFTKNPSRRLDFAFGRSVAERVHALKGAPDPGGDLTPVWRAINGGTSSPKLKLPPSLGVNGDAFLYAIGIDQELLPGRSLGYSKALAFILSRDELFAYVF